MPIQVRSLWQRLALWYTVVTMAIICALDVTGRIADYNVFRRSLTGPKVAAWSTSAVANVAPLLALAEPPVPAVAAALGRMRETFLKPQIGEWAGIEFGFRVGNSQALGLTVLDGDGRVVASDPRREPNLAAGTAELSHDERTLLHRTLTSSGETPVPVVEESSSGVVRLAYPIVSDGQRVGTLLVHLVAPWDWEDFWNQTTNEYFSGVGVLFIVIGLFGVAFGAMTAWRFTRRLTRIAAAADEWSRGDFSRKAEDDSADEIGQLATRLNRMSEDLQTLIRVRQDLATLEERQRIARDLHDSVKQQVFGLTMQIAAARATALQDPGQSAARLSDAGEIVRTLQLELGSLLHQLEPSHGPRSTLTESIREQAELWSRTHEIAACVSGAMAAEPAPPVMRTLLLIVREALANVARHSRARAVRIELTSTGASLAVSVIDDGRGFDPTVVTEGRGVRNMRARATTLPDGWLDIQRQDDGGMRVTVGCRAERAPA